MTSKETGNLFIGMAIGILAGGIAGILLAPKSGAETRQIIADKAKEIAQATKDKSQAILDKVHKK